MAVEAQAMVFRAALFFLLVFALFVLFFASASAEFYVSLFLLAILLFLVCIDPLVKMVSGKFDVFESINFFLLFYFIIFFVGPVFLIFFGGIEESSPEMEAAIAYSVFGVAVFYAGYYWRHSKRLAVLFPNFGSMLDKRRTFLFVAVCFFASIFSFFLFLRLQGGSLFLPKLSQFWARDPVLGTGLISLGWGLLVPAVLVFYAYYKTRGLRHAIYFWAFLIFSCLLLLPSFSRKTLLTMLLALLVFNYYFLKRLALRKIVLMAIILILLSFSIPVLRKASIDLSTPDFLLHSVRETFWGDFFSRYPRFVDLITMMPSETDFFYARPYLDSILVLIPRVLWPAKPIAGETDGTIIEQAFPPNFKKGNIAETTVLGAFYMGFGFAGILVGMFLFGVFFRALFEYLKHNQNNAPAVMFYSAIVSLSPMLVKQLLFLAPVAMLLVPLFLAFKYVGCKK